VIACGDTYAVRLLDEAGNLKGSGIAVGILVSPGKGGY
jgi:hypothetical protein